MASSFICGACNQVIRVTEVVSKEYTPENPRPKPTRTISAKQERINAKAYGARLTPNSGATGGQKSDLYADDLRMECKSTEKGSFSLKKKELELNEAHAADAEIPVFAIEFRGATKAKTKQYMVISEAWFKELLELHRANQNNR